MKKLSILLIGLLLVAGLAFAQDEEEDMTAPAVTLSGSASVTFGADLDTGATGFENSISLNAWVVFWDETQGTEEMDGVYGMIELNGFRFRVGDDEGAETRGSRVTAKIVADPLYVEIYGDGGVGTAYDESVDQANLVGRAAYNAMDLTDVISNDYDAEHMGIAIGADVEIATVEFYVESEYDWKDEDGGDINTANAYAFGLWVSLAPTDELSVVVEADMGVNYATNPIGAGLSVGYDLPIDDTFTAELSAGADVLIDGSALSYEADFGVGLAWPGTAGWSYTKLTGWGNNYSGIGVSGIFYDQGAGADMGVKFSTFEDTAEGLVPTVGWVFDLETIGLLSTTDLGIGLQLDADLDPLMPYALVESDYLLSAAGTTDLYVRVGTDLVGLIPNVSFNLDWDSGDLLAATPVLGALTFTTTISF